MTRLWRWPAAVDGSLCRHRVDGGRPGRHPRSVLVGPRGIATLHRARERLPWQSRGPGVPTKWFIRSRAPGTTVSGVRSGRAQRGGRSASSSYEFESCAAHRRTYVWLWNHPVAEDRHPRRSASNQSDPHVPDPGQCRHPQLDHPNTIWAEQPVDLVCCDHLYSFRYLVGFGADTVLMSDSPTSATLRVAHIDPMDTSDEESTKGPSAHQFRCGRPRAGGTAASRRCAGRWGSALRQRAERRGAPGCPRRWRGTPGFGARAPLAHHAYGWGRPTGVRAGTGTSGA